MYLDALKDLLELLALLDVDLPLEEAVVLRLHLCRQARERGALRCLPLSLNRAISSNIIMS